MTSSALPDDVREFLHDRVESFEQLRALLYLRQGREQAWSADELAQAIRLDREGVAEGLQKLCTDGFIVEEANRYRYVVGSVELEATLDRLARAYRDELLEIMRLMSANAIERLRTAAIRTFADAFVLGRKK